MLTSTTPMRASCAGGSPRVRGRRRSPLPARFRLIPVLLALIALAVGVAACGGGGGDNADARQVVKQTFAGQKRVDSGKLNLSMTAKLQATGLAATQLKEPIVIRMSGPFQSRGDNQLPAMDLQLSATGSGQDFSAGAVSTGDKGYVSFLGKPYTIPDNVFARLQARLRGAAAQGQPVEQQHRPEGARGQPGQLARQPEERGRRGARRHDHDARLVRRQPRRAPQ